MGCTSGEASPPGRRRRRAGAGRHRVRCQKRDRRPARRRRPTRDQRQKTNAGGQRGTNAKRPTPKDQRRRPAPEASADSRAGQPGPNGESPPSRSRESGRSRGSREWSRPPEPVAEVGPAGSVTRPESVVAVTWSEPGASPGRDRRRGHVSRAGCVARARRRGHVSRAGCVARARRRGHVSRAGCVARARRRGHRVGVSRAGSIAGAVEHEQGAANGRGRGRPPSGPGRPNGLGGSSLGGSGGGSGGRGEGSRRVTPRVAGRRWRAAGADFFFGDGWPGPGDGWSVRGRRVPLVRATATGESPVLATATASAAAAPAGPRPSLPTGPVLLPALTPPESSLDPSLPGAPPLPPAALPACRFDLCLPPCSPFWSTRYGVLQPWSSPGSWPPPLASSSPSLVSVQDPRPSHLEVPRASRWPPTPWRHGVVSGARGGGQGERGRTCQVRGEPAPPAGPRGGGGAAATARRRAPGPLAGEGGPPPSTSKRRRTASAAFAMGRAAESPVPHQKRSAVRGEIRTEPLRALDGVERSWRIYEGARNEKSKKLARVGAPQGTGTGPSSTLTLGKRGRPNDRRRSPPTPLPPIWFGGWWPGRRPPVR